MDPHHQRLGRAKEIFADALEHPTRERAAILQAAGTGDPELLEMVNALLDAHAAAVRFMDSPSTAPEAATSIPTAPVEQPGTLIGPYKLLEQIGEGGFGVVFMAEQTAPVVRRVALKVIKLGMDTRQVIARFEAERQALAMMDHPNIAKVFDAGATEAGRPYFVMELVRGDAITAYCDTNSLTTRERLELFTQVCHAVQHAHQKGIIHRDIKPSNVLVTMFDGRPVPKVIDFGIAKATNQRLTDKTLFTAHRHLIGTPQYMSPEQAEMSGVDIDTRSDIYSLGVLLYELLTGSTPFDPEHLRSAALAEVQRIIREEEPEKPSTRLSTLKGSAAEIAARRRTEASRLSIGVRGDLDWIVMKCLEKDRTRRYETANGLAIDVMRHVEGEPVVAAPPSRMYRVRKLVKRNRGAVTTGLLIAAALLAGLGGTTMFALREAAARAEADRQRRDTDRIAKYHAELLERINTNRAGLRLMQDLRERHAAALSHSGYSDAEQESRAVAFTNELARLDATDAAAAMIDRTILRPAVGAIDVQFTDHPLVDASLRQTLGHEYVRLGMMEAAKPLQEQALATRRRLLGNHHPETLESVHEMAAILDRLGPSSEAERYAREAIEGRRRVLGDDHPDTIDSKVQFGAGPWREHGGAAAAVPVVRQILDQSRRVLGPDHETTIDCTARLSYLLLEDHKFQDAEDLARQVLQSRRRTVSDDDEGLVSAVGNVGVALQWQGRFAEAEPFLREAADRCRRLKGADHWESIHCANNLSITLRDMGRMEESLAVRRDVLERRRRVLGPLHVNTLDSLSKVGVLLYELGRNSEAEPIIREAMDARRTALRTGDRGMLDDAVNLGAVLTAQRRLTEAETLLSETLEEATRTLSGTHVTTSRCRRALGEALLASGRFAQAEECFREALPVLVAHNPPGHWGILSTRILLARALTEQRRFTEAERELIGTDAECSRSSSVTPGRYRLLVEGFSNMYEAWALADPGSGYEDKAWEWRARLHAPDWKPAPDQLR